MKLWFAFLLLYRLRLVHLLNSSSSRTCWCIHRSKQWWLAASSGLFGPLWWRDNLRMTYETFSMLVNQLRPYICKQDTKFRLAVTVEERVAITVWRLATNAEYRTLSALFGVGMSTICTIVLETCLAISKHIMPLYVKIPTDCKLTETVNGFKTRWGFPQVAGAIDGSHIPIIRPSESATDYYNRKCFHSIIIQGVVDYQGQFIDAYIGWPGKLHDARVFYNSSFYNKGRQGALFPQQPVNIEGTDIPLLILGDPAYPLLPWLMKPYTDSPSITDAQKHFNYRQSRARMVVENAFGRLKGRWRCLLKRMDCQLTNVPIIVASCVTLHNICERFGDNCQEEWIDNSTVAHTQVAGTSISSSYSGQINTNAALSIRNALTIHLNKH